MAESLRDQLLKSGIAQQMREEKRNEQRDGKRKSAGARLPPARPTGQATPRDADDIDLAEAYAIRAQTEAAERRRAEQQAAEQARLKRERRAKLQALLEGRMLNLADAEHVRHFEYGGKIRRVHVDAAQLAALNAGELGVVQHNGRYLMVTREVAEQARAIDAHALALLIDPTANADDDGIPDDLLW
jgi:uncharacterized protein YaiL (DUF2058 family)